MHGQPWLQQHLSQAHGRGLLLPEASVCPAGSGPGAKCWILPLSSALENPGPFKLAMMS